MKRTLEVCAVGVLLASGTLFAQDDDWKRLMARGQELERDANYSQAASGGSRTGSDIFGALWKYWTNWAEIIRRIALCCSPTWLFSTGKRGRPPSRKLYFGRPLTSKPARFHPTRRV